MPQPKRYASHAQRQAAYHKRREQARARQLEQKGLPPLPAIPAMPGSARWRQAITHATHLLAMVEQEMEAYFDDRSEQWQESEKAEAFQEQLGEVEQARQTLEDLTL